MNRPIACCLATAFCILVPSLALATPDIGQKENGWSISDEKYLEAYDKCWDAFGSDCGRNLLSSAWTDSAPVPHARVVASTARIARWLSPPEPASVASSTYSSGVAPTPATTTVAPASGGCPASLAGEASSPTAVNSSSGAAGCIQAIPSTWAAYGDPNYASAADAPIDVQMEAMQRICAAQGNGAWVAADPC